MSMGKVLVVIGLVLAVIGVAWMLGERLGLGRLPGDLVFEWGNTRVYLPIATSILVSVALTLIFWLIGR
jgi:hypothetical protein